MAADQPTATRREFLWTTGGGFGGVALTALLAADGYMPRARAATPQPAFRPPQPHRAVRARAVICLFMYGGVSQVDTWDPKPALVQHSGKPLPTLADHPELKGR